MIMPYNIALNFEDGVTRFITCNDDETVLDAAYRAHIRLPMDCSDGVCGTCKGACHQGKFDLGNEYIDDALSDEELEAGKVLTCQMVPASDCVVEIPIASSLCKAGPTELTAVVDEVNLVSPTAIELKITAQSPVEFLAGQYVNIQVPGTDQTRAYSFSSKPGSRDLSFLIRNVPVFYLPRLRLPDPTLDRATGFLTPSIRTTSQLGTGLKIPYFIKIGDHKDLTLTPYLSSRTRTLELRYRQAFARGRIEFNGAVTRDDERPDSTRGYVFGYGNLIISE